MSHSIRPVASSSPQVALRSEPFNRLIEGTRRHGVTRRNSARAFIPCQKLGNDPPQLRNRLSFRNGRRAPSVCMTAAEPPRNIEARQSWGLLPKLQDFLFDGRRFLARIGN
jgi:hypothetical protein